MKPTDKTADALQAMLAFLALATDGHHSHNFEPAAMIGSEAFHAITSLYRGDPRMLALRDLVQAAADERMVSGELSTPSATDDPFVDIKANHEAAERGDVSAVAGAHHARAWLISEVERLRAAHNIDKQ